MRPGEEIMLPSGTAFIEKKKICRYYDHHHIIITSVGALAEGNDVYVVKTANTVSSTNDKKYLKMEKVVCVSLKSEEFKQTSVGSSSLIFTVL